MKYDIVAYYIIFYCFNRGR